MEYKEFKDGNKLSRLGMGNMRLPVKNGDDSQIDYKKAKKMISQCIQNGINYYDWYFGGAKQLYDILSTNKTESEGLKGLSSQQINRIIYRI